MGSPHSIVLDDALPAILGGRPIRPEGPPEWPMRTDEIAAIFSKLQQTGDWGRYHGPHCEELRTALQGVFPCEQVILCSSGTAAIEFCLRGAGVSPGDEVILSAYDFKSNFTNVLSLDAKPVLVGIRSENAQLDLASLESARTAKTRAVIASHLHGGLLDVPSIRDWADQHGIVVIEDVCQAPGASINGRPAGSWGDCAALSFGGSKLLTAGRGGAVLCQSEKIAQRIKLHNERGNTASPLSEIQAALLVPQVKRLRRDHQHRGASVESLKGQLASIAGLHAFRNEIPESSASYYKLGLFYSPKAFDGMSRELFCQSIRAEGVALDPGLSALHETHARRRFRTVGDLERASQQIQSIVTLHHPVLLRGAIELQQIVSSVQRVQRFAARIAEEYRAV